MLMILFLSYLLCARYRARSWGQKDKQDSHRWVTIYIVLLPQCLAHGRGKKWCSEFWSDLQGGLSDSWKNNNFIWGSKYICSIKFSSLASDVTLRLSCIWGPFSSHKLITWARRWVTSSLVPSDLSLVPHTVTWSTSLDQSWQSVLQKRVGWGSRAFISSGWLF